MENATNTPALLRRKEVEAKTGLPRSAIYEMIQEGKFPAQVKLGIGRCVAWVESDIDQWIQDRIDNGRQMSSPGNRRQQRTSCVSSWGGARWPSLILRTKADTYGIQWSDIEKAREDGLGDLQVAWQHDLTSLVVGVSIRPHQAP